MWKNDFDWVSRENLKSSSNYRKHVWGYKYSFTLICVWIRRINIDCKLHFFKELWKHDIEGD